MKSYSILTVVLVLTLSLSSCGARAEATPTIDPVALQGTMAAAALTMVAQTQAAIPTATPIPPTATPTDTPLPTVTLPPLPSLGATFTSVPGGNSGGDDPCIHQVLPADLEGETVRMRIDNSTRASVNVSVYLNQNGPQGQCGYRSYALEPGQFVVINDLVEGCYTIWAWNPDPDEYFIVTNGTTCVDTSATWAFDISTGSIRLR